MKTVVKQTFEEFIQIKKQINSMGHNLSRLGIHLKPTDSTTNYTLNYEDSPCIMKELDKLTFFDKLTKDEELGLALAVTQESQNDFISQSQIKTVNDFFGTSINFELVQNLNSKYV